MSEANLKVGGGGGVPIRSIAWFPHGTDPDITINGERFLRNGLLETDPAKFDAGIWGDTPGLHWKRTVFFSWGSGYSVKDIESNETGDIMVALIQALSGYQPHVLVTVNGGANWSARSAINSGMDGLGLYSLAFGAGKFVAVGDGGNILTSTDGSSWTKRDSKTSAGLLGVKWNGSMFVAVGQSVILTSPDGLTWTSRTVPVGISGRVIMAAAFGNNVWVVAGQSGEIATAPADGSVWTFRDSNNKTGGCLIFEEGDGFISSGGRAAKSPDGIDWTAITATEGPLLHTSGSMKMFKMNGYYYWADRNLQTVVRSKDLKSKTPIYPVPIYEPTNKVPYLTGFPGDNSNELSWVKKLVNGKIYLNEDQGGRLVLFEGNTQPFAGSPLIAAQTPMNLPSTIYQIQLQPYTRIS